MLVAGSGRPGSVIYDRALVMMNSAGNEKTSTQAIRILRKMYFPRVDISDLIDFGGWHSF